MRQLPYLLLILMIVTACTSQDSSAPEPTPAPSSTPQADITGLYSGPLLDTDLEEVGESEGCTADGECASGEVPIVDFGGQALPLSTQSVAQFTLPIPEGYNPIDRGAQVIVSAERADTPGGYFFSARLLADDATLATELLPYPEPASTEPVTGEALQGYWFQSRADAVVAVLRGDDAQIVLVEAFADPGNWQAFQPTFLEMLDQLQVHAPR